MYGLTRITLHNSYYKSLTANVRASGHTNCSGTNAAGKTTMLKLIPLFYGCQQRLLNPKSQDKQPFLDFVLPAASSLLIYDYSRHDGDCCSVIYRGPKSIAYRFVRGSSRETFFSDSAFGMMQEGAPATEVFNHLIAQGVEISRQITSIAEYGDILQNNLKGGPRKTRPDRDTVRDASRFSLGGSGSSMQLMGEMTYTLLKRTSMFERLKQMVIETQFSYEPPKIPQNRNNINLAANLRGLRQFTQVQGGLRECVRVHIERVAVETKILRFARGVTGGLERITSDLALLEESLEQERKRKFSESERQDKELQVLQQDLDRDNWQRKQCKRSIEKAEAEHDQWIEQDVASKEEDFANLKGYRERAVEAQDHYQSLIQSQKGEVEAREKQLNEIRNKLLERQAELRVAMDNHQRQIHALKDTHRQQIAEVERDTQAKVEKLRNESQGQRDDLIAVVSRLEAEISGADLNNEERLEAAEIEERIEAIDVEIERLEQDKAKATEAEQAARQRHKELLGKVVDQERAHSKAAEVKRSLELLCHPADGTLLSELRAAKPDWTESIGRVINPDLLVRKDLSPEVVGGTISLYGLAVDLEKIDRGEHCRQTEVLLDELEKASSIQRSQLEALEAIKARAREAEKALKECQQGREALDREERLARHSRGEAVNFQRRLRDKHRVSISARKQDLREVLESKRKDLQRLEREIDAEVVAIRERSQVRAKGLSDSHLIAESDFNAKIDHLKQVENADREVANKRQAEVNEAYERRLQELDMDPVAIRAAKEDQDRALAKVTAVESYVDILERHRAWRAHTWQNVEAWRAEVHDLDTKIVVQDRAIKTLRYDYSNLMLEIVGKIRSLEAEIREKNQLLAEARELIARVGAPPDGESEPGELDYLCYHLSGLIDSHNDLKNRVLELVSNATNILSADSGSKVYEAWDLLVQVRRHKSPHQEYSDQFRLQLPDDLEALLDQHVPQIRESMIETVKAVGQLFVQFYQTLRSLEVEVARVSRDLKSKINTDQRIAALSNIELNLTSRVGSAIAGWDDLGAFVREWGDWESFMKVDLPPESLEKALEGVIALFQHAPVKTDIGSLVDLTITLEESGRKATIDSDASFDDASSNGLSYLALIVIFVGMSRYLCPDRDVALTWPVDELATLDPANVSSLFAMLDRNKISMFSAFPSLDYNLLQHFSNRYVLHRTKGVMELLDDLNGRDEDVEKVVGLLDGEEVDDAK